MADLAAPRIDSVSRVNGKDIAVTYTAMQSGYTRVYFYVRANGGALQQATSTTTLTGSYTITSIGGAPLSATASYEVSMKAANAAGVTSDYSTSKSVGPWDVPEPTLLDAERTGASTIRLAYEGARVGGGAKLYAEVRVTPGGNWTQRTSWDATSAAGTYTLYGLDGLTSYEVRVRSGQYGVYSGYSTPRTAATWWQAPPVVQNMTATRVGNGVRVAWTLPSTTGRNAIESLRLTYGVRGGWSSTTTLDPTDTSWTLANALAADTYEFSVVSVNPAGSSTSTATATSGATVSAPAALTQAPTVTMNNTVATVAWTANPSASQPVDSWTVAWTTTGGASGSKYVVGGAVRSTTLNLPANAIADITVLPSNQAGSAPNASPAARVVTIPRGLSRLTAARVGGDATLTLARDGATIATSWEIEHTVDPAGKAAEASTWFPVGSPGVSASPQTWTHAGAAGGVPHTYRARPLVDGWTWPEGQGWVYSNTLSAYAAPLPPIVERPESVAPADPMVVTWTHSPIDGTPQVAARMRHRKVGTATWTTVSVTGATAEATIPASTYAVGDQVEIQVQTRGQSTTYSPYSSSLVVEMRARPTVVATSPVDGSYLPGPEVMVEWTTPVQLAWQLRWAHGAAEYVEFSGTDERSILLDAPIDGLDNYIMLRVWDGMQWSDWTYTEVTTKFDLPVAPSLIATPNTEAATVTLQAVVSQGLQRTRVNYRQYNWQWDGGTEPARFIYLSGQDYLRAYQVFAAGASATQPGGPVGEPLSASLSFTSLTVPMTAVFNGESVEVPVWPESVRVTRPATGGATAITISGADVVMFDRLLQPAYADEGATDDSYFYHHTTRDGFRYGLLEPDVAYEAVGVGSGGDIPVAATVEVRFQRALTPTGPWVDLGSTGSPWVMVDDMPPYGAPLWYRAGAVAANRSIAWGAPVRVDLATQDVIVTLADGTSVRGGWNPNLTHAAGRDVTKVRYAGHDVDTGYPGARKARTVSAQVTVDEDSGSTLAEWLRAAETEHPVTYRDPSGRIMVGWLDGVSWSGTSSLWQTVSLSVSEGQ